MSAAQIQGLVTCLAPFLIQLMKNSGAKLFSWWSAASPKVSVLTNFIVSGITAAGIVVTHAPGALTISWPTLDAAVPGLLTFLVTLAAQLALNHVAFKAVWKNLLPAA
jgi:hypothetical protein